MTNATVADNVATLQAGGLFLSEGTLDLKNSNIWANTAMQTMGVEDPQIGLFAMAATANWSNVEGGWKGAGTNNFDVNPRMTPDGHLSADSPLINAGDPGFVPSPSGASEGDADPRIHGGRVDIGADEFRDTDADGLPDYWEAAYAAAASVVSRHRRPRSQRRSGSRRDDEPGRIRAVRQQTRRQPSGSTVQPATTPTMGLLQRIWAAWQVPRRTSRRHSMPRVTATR